MQKTKKKKKVKKRFSTNTPIRDKKDYLVDELKFIKFRRYSATKRKKTKKNGFKENVDWGVQYGGWCYIEKDKAYNVDYLNFTILQKCYAIEQFSQMNDRYLSEEKKRFLFDIYLELLERKKHGTSSMLERR